jgi:chemotaxis protein CheX
MARAQIEIFIKNIEHYFSKRSNQKIIIETPYLTNDINQILSDFTGIISISGAYRGWVCFTAPTQFLEKIIQTHGQNNFNTALLKDAIGEITNTLSGNSRRELGNHFVISVPKVIHGNKSSIELIHDAHSFVVPMKWFGYSATLVISIIEVPSFSPYKKYA